MRSGVFSMDIVIDCIGIEYLTWVNLAIIQYYLGSKFTGANNTHFHVIMQLISISKNKF